MCLLSTECFGTNAPMLESSCGGLRPYNGKKTSASSKAVRPRLPGGLRPEAGERHRN